MSNKICLRNKLRRVETSSIFGCTFYDMFMVIFDQIQNNAKNMSRRLKYLPKTYKTDKIYV